MDMPSTWLPELEMQDQGFMNQYNHEMNKPYHHHHQLMEDFSVDSFSSDSYTDTPSNFIDQSAAAYQQVPPPPPDIKQPSSFNNNSNYRRSSINTTSSINKLKQFEKPKPKPKQQQQLASTDTTPNTFTISFGDIKPKDEILSFTDSYINGCPNKKVPTMIRNPIQVQDHVLAERKRREKLAQRFISLSSLLPDLKKMDKATVLEDAANYIQELQNRVKELEELSGGLISKRKSMQLESAAISKRSRLSGSCDDEDDDGSSSNEGNFEESIISSSPCNPEIEVRTSGCNLLVEIYCRKNSISLVKMLSEMQKLGLSIVSCSTMPFADTTLLITIVAQKNDEFNMSSEDLVKNLQLAI